MCDFPADRVQGYGNCLDPATGGRIRRVRQACFCLLQRCADLAPNLLRDAAAPRRTEAVAVAGNSLIRQAERRRVLVRATRQSPCFRRTAIDRCINVARRSAPPTKRRSCRRAAQRRNAARKARSCQVSPDIGCRRECAAMGVRTGRMPRDARLSVPVARTRRSTARPGAGGRGAWQDG